jgi:hypothetical protein
MAEKQLPDTLKSGGSGAWCERRPRREKQTTNIRADGGAPTQKKTFAAGAPLLQKSGSVMSDQADIAAKLSIMVWGMRSSMTVLSTTPNSTAARGMP